MLALKAAEPARSENAAAHSELAAGTTQWLLDFSSKARAVKARMLAVSQLFDDMQHALTPELSYLQPYVHLLVP